MTILDRAKNVGQGVLDWLDHRAQLGAGIREAAEHPVPRNTASWWYVFGSASLVTFILQLVTGICLAMVYVPSADGAYGSLLYLNHQQPLGWFVRALHGWGSNFMVVLVVVHMVQVFLFGAYKYPRELTWLVGVVLLLLTLGLAFTGQIMRWDEDAYWGLSIVASISGRTPFVGDLVVRLLLGGPVIAGETLSRFFTLHVFVLPGVVIGLIGLHLLLVLNLGINEWPMPGRLVTRERYKQEYEHLVHTDGEPFVPGALKKDLVFSGLIIIALVVVAAVVGPIGPLGPPDPTLIETQPRPDYPFLFLFSVFALLPAWMEEILLMNAPIAAVGGLLALPFLSGTGEKSWWRRPISVIVVSIILVGIGTFHWLGTFIPWSPVMDAWTAAPIPPEMVRGRTPLELQGALLVQSKQCRNCHALGEGGGLRGPALDDTAARLTKDQLVRQIIQGGGNMPAYGKNLTPAETDAIVAFLATMVPPGSVRAREGTDPGVPGTPQEGKKHGEHHEATQSGGGTSGAG